MPSLGSNMKNLRHFTVDTLFRLINQTNNYDIIQSFSLADSEQTKSLTDENSINGYLTENDFRHLWYLLSQMIRKRLLKHEPCLLSELGAFVIIDYSSSDDLNIPVKEPFFVLDTTFARRHRLSRITRPNLSSALSHQVNGNSMHIDPDTTLSSFNMQTLDYTSLQNESGLAREQLTTAISHLFGIIDREIHPYGYCDLEFPQLGNFRISFGLATFEFSESFLDEFKRTLNTGLITND